MKYLVIIENGSGYKNANIFDDENAAINFQKEIISYLKYPIEVRWNNRKFFVAYITDQDKVFCRILEAARAEYRLVKHAANKKDEERRFFVRQNAVDYVKKQRVETSREDDDNGFWLGKRPDEDSYKLYAAILHRSERDTVISRFESSSAIGIVSYLLGGYVDDDVFTEEPKMQNESEPKRQVRVYSKKRPTKRRPARERKNMSKALKIVLASAAAVIAFIVFAALNIDWQMVSDEIKASKFEKDITISSMADDLKLTRKGKAVLFASQPKLKNKSQFNMTCGRDGASVYTAGCYYGYDDDDEHIDIFDTGAETFNENGVSFNFSNYRRSVLLHELMHAAYERLDSKKQENLCVDLKAMARGIEDLSDEISIYSSNQVCSELFARVGAEYISILNAHSSYNRHFNSQTILKNNGEEVENLSKVYKDYFDFSNYSIAESYHDSMDSLDALGDKIDYYNMLLALRKQRADSLINQYYIWPTWARYNNANSAISEYNSLIPIYNSYAKTYNKLLDRLDSEMNVNPWGSITW